MPFPMHWTAATHAQRMPFREKAPQTYEQVDFTSVNAVCSRPDPRRVALNLAYLTRGMPMGERRELLAMMGVGVVSLFGPDSPLWAVPRDEPGVCPDCGGSLRHPCICDYFADPDDTLEAA